MDLRLSYNPSGFSNFILLLFRHELKYHQIESGGIHHRSQKKKLFPMK